MTHQGLPAKTVTVTSSQNWIRHKGVLRRITLLEVKILQGFPDDWKICGNEIQTFKQVGNAVPTVLGKLLGACLAEPLNHEDTFPPIKIKIPKTFQAVNRLHYKELQEEQVCKKDPP